MSEIDDGEHRHVINKVFSLVVYDYGLVDYIPGNDPTQQMQNIGNAFEKAKVDAEKWFNEQKHYRSIEAKRRRDNASRSDELAGEDESESP